MSARRYLVRAQPRDGAGLTAHEFATLSRAGALQAMRREHERRQQAGPLLDDWKIKLAVACGVLPPGTEL